MKKYAPVFAITLLALIIAGASWFLMFDKSAEAPPSGGSDLISGKPQTVPVPGVPTMVDIGAHSCIPCKMMTPIIQELSVEYKDRAAIVFIDVWRYPDQTAKYGIRAIPTQIFYDAKGVERYRHQGFMDKPSIMAKLAEIGAR